MLPMNGSKRVTIIILVMLIPFSMWGCGILSVEQPHNEIPTISVTDTTEPTRTPTPPPTLTPSDTPLPPTPTRTPLPFMALDGLRVVYTDSNGNLYVQDSGKPSMQLTQGVKESTEGRPPLISDDGQKIVFYRAGETKLDLVYAINTDGTGEQMLITPELLSAFGKPYDGLKLLVSLAFVPGTHLLLFNTFQTNYNDPEAAGWLPLVGNDLFVVNTDTGKIKQLKAPGQGGNFLAAPNGKWVAVQTLDHIDVIDTQGRVIHRNLVTHDKTEAHVIVPMAWTPDSKELIILPSEIPLFAGIRVIRTIWRYPVDGGSGTEIKLTPPVEYDAYAVSPDGNWIAYSYDSGRASNTTSGLYLGNLRDGTSQLLYALPQREARGRIDGWSLDNVHFVFSDLDDRMYMGNIHGEIIPLGRGAGILGWADNNHYILGNGVVGDVDHINVFDDYIYYLPIAFVFLRH
jgi:Tol biopolymer transport system component